MDTSKKKRRLLQPSLDLADMMEHGLPPVPWIVEPFMAEGELIMLLGDFGTYKSWLALDTAIGIAAGQEVFHGRKPDSQMGVVYFDEESSTVQLVRRALQLARGRSIGSDMLRAMRNENYLNVYSLAHIRFDSDQGRSFLYQAINKHRPAVVIFDVFRSFHRQNENDNQAMGSMIYDKLQPLARDCNMCVMFLHHTNKEPADQQRERIGPRRATHATRGASAIPDGVDGIYIVEKRNVEGVELPVLYMEKTRYAAEEDRPDPFAFRARQSEGDKTVRVETYDVELGGREALARATTLEELKKGVVPLVRLIELGTEKGFGERTLMRALAQLYKKGVVKRQHEGRSTTYRLAEDNKQ